MRLKAERGIFVRRGYLRSLRPIPARRPIPGLAVRPARTGRRRPPRAMTLNAMEWPWPFAALALFCGLGGHIVLLLLWDLWKNW